jgi:hypothetical protein
LTTACEVCCGAYKRPASVVVVDVREVPPEGRWRRWAPDGPPHFYCDAHARGPARTYLPGTSADEINRLRSEEAYAKTLRGYYGP